MITVVNPGDPGYGEFDVSFDANTGYFDLDGNFHPYAVPPPTLDPATDEEIRRKLADMDAKPILPKILLAGGVALLIGLGGLIVWRSFR